MMISQKGILVFVLVGLVAVAAKAASIYGLGFGAPTINDKANVSGPAKGEIVFDDSDDTFYGYTGSGWTELADSDSNVVSPVAAGIRIVTARIANTGTPTPTIEDGDWIASIDDVATGDMTFNLQSGIFSDNPRCFITPEQTNTAARSVTVSATEVAVDTFTLGGTKTDFNFQIMCIGAQ